MVVSKELGFDDGQMPLGRVKRSAKLARRGGVLLSMGAVSICRLEHVGNGDRWYVASSFSIWLTNLETAVITVGFHGSSEW